MDSTGSLSCMVSSRRIQVVIRFQMLSMVCLAIVSVAYAAIPLIFAKFFAYFAVDTTAYHHIFAFCTMGLFTGTLTVTILAVRVLTVPFRLARG